MTDLVIAIAFVGSLAFGAVWSLFGALSWFEEWIEQRHHRMNPSWLQQRVERERWS